MLSLVKKRILHFIRGILHSLMNTMQCSKAIPKLIKRHGRYATFHNSDLPYGKSFYIYCTKFSEEIQKALPSARLVSREVAENSSHAFAYIVISDPNINNSGIGVIGSFCSWKKRLLWHTSALHDEGQMHEKTSRRFPESLEIIYNKAKDSIAYNQLTFCKTYFWVY